MQKNLLPLACSFSLILVSACQYKDAPNSLHINQISALLQGRVSWPTQDLRIQASLTDIQSQATVSLIYPSDHATRANQTIATGITNAEGEFVLSPGNNFTTAAGSIFVLEASKRIDGPGHPLLTLRTLLRWNGSAWSSITGTTVQINALTTAIAIMSHYESSISSALTIESAVGGAIPAELGDKSSEDIEGLRDLVSQALFDNQDPNHFIEQVGGLYQVKEGVNQATNICYGKVFDDTNVHLDGVTVRARSLSAGLPYDATTTTVDGSYVFNDVPVGAQVEITASKEGYATRTRVEVVSEHTTDEAYTNRFDFGNDGAVLLFGLPFNGLSDKPEVIQVTPGRNSSGVDPSTSFVLKFSEPMDRQTVVNTFQIRAFGPDEQLTVDSATTFNGGSAVDGRLENSDKGDLIWDKTAFNVSWSPDDSEATFTFKDERALPSDKNTANTPAYSVSFQGGNHVLKDKSGIARFEQHFKLTNAPFEDFYQFGITSDEMQPGIDSITAIAQENSGFSNGDHIKVRFSERMIHYTLAGTIAGGINGIANHAAAAVSGAHNFVASQDAAANYLIQINGGTPFEWGSLGYAVYDSNDPTHKTVLLAPTNIGDNIFQPGDTVFVEVKTTVLDPAGNSVDSSDSDAFTVAS